VRSFVILTAGSCGDAHLTEPDDESAEPEVVLGLTPPGALSVFTDGFRHLQGLAVNATTLFAATRGRQSEPQADGVVYRIPILADGTAGPASTPWPRDAFKKSMGLARDRLGALWLTTKELELDPRVRRSARDQRIGAMGGYGAARSARARASLVIGRSVKRAPVASASALAIAAGAATTGGSPTPLAPKGPCSVGTSRMTVSSVAGAASIPGSA